MCLRSATITSGSIRVSTWTSIATSAPAPRVRTASYSSRLGPSDSRDSFLRKARSAPYRSAYDVNFPWGGSPNRWPRPSPRVSRVRPILMKYFGVLACYLHTRPRGGPHGKSLERSTLSVSHAPEEPQLHLHRCAGSGPRHRCEHRHLQRFQRRTLVTASHQSPLWQSPVPGNVSRLRQSVALAPKTLRQRVFSSGDGFFSASASRRTNLRIPLMAACAK